MNNADLPAPIASYFTMDRSKSFAKAAECFAANAVVRDEKRSIEGIPAIVNWKQESHLKYAYTAEPLSIIEDEGKHRVVVKVSGQFPGSPLNLTYVFRLVNNKISYLEIS